MTRRVVTVIVFIATFFLFGTFFGMADELPAKAECARAEKFSHFFDANREKFGSEEIAAVKNLINDGILRGRLDDEGHCVLSADSKVTIAEAMKVLLLRMMGKWITELTGCEEIGQYSLERIWTVDGREHWADKMGRCVHFKYPEYGLADKNPNDFLTGAELSTMLVHLGMLRQYSDDELLNKIEQMPYVTRIQLFVLAVKIYAMRGRSRLLP